MDNVRILVVEDESIVALDIKSRLQNLGYKVPKIASNGNEAIKDALEIRPDIILMDIKLRGKIDGVEAAKQIREQYDIPIIYLTAYADKVTLQRAKITQSFGYLLKPFEERELNATIETALYKHKMERQLRENEQWLSTTLTSIGDAVIATDRQGCIKFMNPIAENLTGWTQVEAKEQPALNVFRVSNEQTQLDHIDPVAQVLQKGIRLELSNHILLQTKDDGEIPIDVTISPIIDDKDAVNGAVLVFRDMSQQRATEDKLRQYADQLQAHNQELDAFAHTVAHDLQSPLSTIVSLADALRIYQASMTSEEMKDYLGHLVQNGLKTSSIVDSLLLLASVRRRENIDSGVLNTAQIMDEVEERLSYMAKEYNATIHKPKTWPAAVGYAPWVEEVWVNYISNAIKYGGTPPVLHLGADITTNGMVRFWVQDNGLGLSTKNQKQLFIPFTKLSQAKIKGQGLGLSIVRRIVDKLDGTVGVFSKGILGEGSRFYFTLPAPPKEQQPLTENSQSEQAL